MAAERNRARLRRGFSMMEIAIALAIISIMVAVIIPSVTTRIDQARISYMQTTLDNVLTGIRNYKTNVTKYPQSLAQLSYIPDANNPNDICNLPLGTNIAKWRGPYISLDIGSNKPSDPAFLLGLPLGDYTANDRLIRTPAGVSSTPGRIDVKINGVTSTDWQRLNDIVDGQSGTIPLFKPDGSDTSGTVRYDVPTSVLNYGMVITGC